MTTFPTEFLFQRLSDFWDKFQEREDIKGIWDAYLRKTNALQSLLKQAALSRSLSSIPLFDKNSLEYFVFSTLAERPDLEFNSPFYVFEVDPLIFFIKDLNEKIDNTIANRVLSSPRFYQVVPGVGADAGKVLLQFFRGVAPSPVGQTLFTTGSNIVTGIGFLQNVSVGDIIQGQNQDWFKVIQVNSDTQLTIQGQTFLNDPVGIGDGSTTVFHLSQTENIITASVVISSNGMVVNPSNYTITSAGLLTFTTAPRVGSVITATYYLGYNGPTAYSRRTMVESIPAKLFSTAVYRDRSAVYQNFGFGIGLQEPTSFTYLNKVRGIYFARYNGPTIENVALGGGILTSIPFSERGTVQSINTIPPQSVIVNSSLIQVPDPLVIEVTAGQQLQNDFNLLTDGIQVADYINSPDIFNLAPLATDPSKFFTFLVIIKGSYAAFVAATTGQPLDLTTINNFTNTIKPSYTKYAIAPHVDFIQDDMSMYIGPVDVTNAFDAAATLEFNGLNYVVISDYLTANGFANEAAAIASNLVNMDQDVVQMYEGLLIQDAISTPPLSGNPPWNPGATQYSM